MGKDNIIQLQNIGTEGPVKANLRESIEVLISHIKPHDDLEDRHIQETLSWIRSGVPIFRIQKPDIPPKHLVSYFVLYDEHAQKILLVDHKKSGLWLPAGGHVDINEHPNITAIRECQEELNIEPEFLYEAPIFLTSTITVGQTAGHIDVSLWYVFKGEEAQNYNYDPSEFNAIKWYGFEDIPYQKSDPHMRRFVEKLKLMI